MHIKLRYGQFSTYEHFCLYYLYIYVCVWNVCIDVKLPWHCWICYFGIISVFKQAGGWSVLQMSPSNEDASVAQWYGLGTLNPRTCSIFFHFRPWPPAKPRTGMSFYSTSTYSTSTFLHSFTRSPQSDWAASEQSFGFIIHYRRHIVADAYWLDNLRRRHRRWHYFWLINFPILILFFLKSIQGMENIQENFHYS